jgi:hypothetical protein
MLVRYYDYSEGSLIIEEEWFQRGKMDEVKRMRSPDAPGLRLRSLT